MLKSSTKQNIAARFEKMNFKQWKKPGNVTAKEHIIGIHKI